jgi:hypothetical protein
VVPFTNLTRAVPLSSLQRHRPKHAAESHDVPDPATDGYRFNPLDLTHNLEIHGPILGSIGQGSNLLPVEKQVERHGYKAVGLHSVWLR